MRKSILLILFAIMAGPTQNFAFAGQDPSQPSITQGKPASPTPEAKTEQPPKIKFGKGLQSLGSEASLPSHHLEKSLQPDLTDYDPRLGRERREIPQDTPAQVMREENLGRNNGIFRNIPETSQPTGPFHTYPYGLANPGNR